ncbi:MAG: pilus assembly protein [Natronohydrobacter sp.]|nr:pilus assembly protein [Natronohydrobacter sp.]
MKLFANIKTFAADESGAVTVDWVVLTAAIVGLGIAVIASVRQGTNAVGTQIQTSLNSAQIDLLGNLSTPAPAPAPAD